MDVVGWRMFPNGMENAVLNLQNNGFWTVGEIQDFL